MLRERHRQHQHARCLLAALVLAEWHSCWQAHPLGDGCTSVAEPHLSEVAALQPTPPCASPATYAQEKKQREKEQKQQEEAQGDGDPDMMALMGFGGFGTTKK